MQIEHIFDETEMLDSSFDMEDVDVDNDEYADTDSGIDEYVDVDSNVESSWGLNEKSSFDSFCSDATFNTDEDLYLNKEDAWILDVPVRWFNDVRMNYGETLTDEMIVNSVQQASNFFNIDNPMAIAEDWTTGVYPNMDVSPIDDVLIFNREQLVGMGITEQEGLDLVMTHECAHRALQGMSQLGFDSLQEELCCDFMAGVRAGLNGIDVSQMENSLVNTSISITHPDGADRVDAIEAGMEFAKEYYEVHGVAPSFNNCLKYFNGEADLADLAPDGQITLRSESPVMVYESSDEAVGSVGFADSDIEGGVHTIREYTQSEIGEFSPTDIEKNEEALNRYEALKDEYDSRLGIDDGNDNSNPSFGARYNKEYYQKKAEADIQKAKDHEKYAADEMKIGNIDGYSGYNHHMRIAKSYHDSAEKNLKLAKEAAEQELKK